MRVEILEHCPATVSRTGAILRLKRLREALRQRPSSQRFGCVQPCLESQSFATRWVTIVP